MHVSWQHQREYNCLNPGEEPQLTTTQLKQGILWCPQPHADPPWLEDMINSPLPHCLDPRYTRCPARTLPISPSSVSTGVEQWLGEQVDQWLVVHVDYHVQRLMQIATPPLTGQKYRQELMILDRVIAFCSQQFVTKKATGCSVYSRTAPTWVSEVSVHRTIGRSRVGKCSMGGVTKASHSWSNADC